MPNKARYLTREETDEIISLRGKTNPNKIAVQYGIGLTRLYKIWTDATQDKQFPGGVAGTQAGKKLTKVTKKLKAEINQLREQTVEDKKIFNENKKMIEENKKKLQRQYELSDKILADLKTNKQNIEQGEQALHQQRLKLEELNKQIAENKNTIENQLSTIAELNIYSHVKKPGKSVEQILTEALLK